MIEFVLTGEVTVSVFTVVEAETIEEAIEIAQQRNIEAAELRSGNNQSRKVWVNEEYDGEITNIKEA